MENSTLEKVTREQRQPVIELKTEADCVKESVLQPNKKADETPSEIFSAVNKKNENKKQPPCSMAKMNVESPICIPYLEHSNASSSSSFGHPILTSSSQWPQSFPYASTSLHHNHYSNASPWYSYPYSSKWPGFQYTGLEDHRPFLGDHNCVGIVDGEHHYREPPSRTLFVLNVDVNVVNSVIRTLFEVSLLYINLMHQ